MKHHNILATLIQIPGRYLTQCFHEKKAFFQSKHRVVLQESPLAGFQYHRGPAIWPFLQVGEILHLKREPYNPHDRYAIAVWFKNEHLGYIPRHENRTIAQLLDQGEHLEASIVRLLEDDNLWHKIHFQVAWITNTSLAKQCKQS
ncbi:MAG: HIRAN domain-containing protein [Candidatus Thiodiazotropha sp.]|jgi:hypothetical protein